MSEWQHPESAPLWVEVIVKYPGNRCFKSQPNCIGTSVKTEKGWDLGSKPGSREPICWQHFPEGPTEEELSKFKSET